MWDMAFAYNNGKLYVVGGERCPAIFFWVNTNVSFVYDIATGRSHSLTLPFDAQRGKLLFSGNKALYILSEQRGSGSRRRVLAGMTDMTTSGWFHNWEVLPKAIHNLWSEDTDTISMAFKGTEANALRILTKNAVHAWDYRTFNHPAGTIRPDPVFPGPDPDPDPDPQPDPHPQPPIPSSGGGGCSAGAFSPWMVLLAVPLLMLKKKQ
jgi:Synergist-CTERM protein sorting domain-containing protein